jgi:hypothetical protein
MHNQKNFANRYRNIVDQYVCVLRKESVSWISVSKTDEMGGFTRKDVLYEHF